MRKKYDMQGGMMEKYEENKSMMEKYESNRTGDGTLKELATIRKITLPTIESGSYTNKQLQGNCMNTQAYMKQLVVLFFRIFIL